MALADPKEEQLTDNSLYMNAINAYCVTETPNTIRIPNVERAENRYLLNYVPQIF